MTDFWKNMFNSSEQIVPATKPPAWEPTPPDESLPEPIRKAMIRTQHIDHERELRRIDRIQRDAMQRTDAMQQADALDAVQYGMGIQNVGLGGAALAGQAGGALHVPTGIFKTATEMEKMRRGAQSQNQRMNAIMQQGSLVPEQWSQKLLDEFGKQVLQPTKRWNMGNDGTAAIDGIMRIAFPFGQVEMPISNETELERAYEMAKHMLKTHEEMSATAAIKKDIEMRKAPKITASGGASQASFAIQGQI